MEGIVVLNIETRTNTSKGANKLLRQRGYLPSNIFGKGTESVAITVKKDELIRALKVNGRNAVFKLVTAENVEYTAMVKEIQIKPLVNEVAHVDFQQVSLSEKVKMDIAIRLEGTDFLESKRLLVNRHIDLIPVSGLPQAIPDELVIDVANLKSGDSILFKDIKLPSGVTSDLEAELIVLSVSGSRVQEVVESEEE